MPADPEPPAEYEGPAAGRPPARVAGRPRRGLRRGEILAAAAALFAERGYHGVSIDDIGAAVGMSGPGLYRHFPGKDAVLAEMLLDISARLHAAGARLAAGAPDAPAALDALLRWHIGFALSEPDLITVQSRELANVPEPARRRIRRLQRLYVEEWVTVLSELAPQAPPAGLRTAVHATFGLLNSTPHLVSSQPGAASQPGAPGQPGAASQHRAPGQHGAASPGRASDLPPEAAAGLLLVMARAALGAAARWPRSLPLSIEYPEAGEAAPVLNPLDGEPPGSGGA